MPSRIFILDGQPDGGSREHFGRAVVTDVFYPVTWIVTRRPDRQSGALARPVYGESQARVLRTPAPHALLPRTRRASHLSWTPCLLLSLRIPWSVVGQPVAQLPMPHPVNSAARRRKKSRCRPRPKQSTNPKSAERTAVRRARRARLGRRCVGFGASQPVTGVRT